MTDASEKPDIAPADLRMLAIMGLALVSGAAIFGAIAVALPLIGAGEGLEAEPDAGLVQILSVVHAALFLGALVGAAVVPARLPAGGPGNVVLTRYVLRWALVEGPALFGCVIVLIAGQSGVLPGQPVYYANLVSFLALTAFVVNDLGRLKDRQRMAA